MLAFATPCLPIQHSSHSKESTRSSAFGEGAASQALADLRFPTRPHLYKGRAAGCHTKGKVLLWEGSTHLRPSHERHLAQPYLQIPLRFVALATGDRCVLSGSKTIGSQVKTWFSQQLTRLVEWPGSSYWPVPQALFTSVLGVPEWLEPWPHSRSLLVSLIIGISLFGKFRSDREKKEAADLRRAEADRSHRKLQQTALRAAIRVAEAEIRAAEAEIAALETEAGGGG
jgi:hypothetical protein